MRLRTAIEVAALLAAKDPPTSAPAAGSVHLTPRKDNWSSWWRKGTPTPKSHSSSA
jgi:hypothetical protein